MFGIWNRKPEPRFKRMGRMASRRWNRMMGRELTAWQQAGMIPAQAGEAVKNRPWIGVLAASLLLAGLAFTFGRRFMGQAQF